MTGVQTCALPILGTIIGSTCCPGKLLLPDYIYGTLGTLVLGNPLKYYTRKKIKGIGINQWDEIILKKNNPRAELIKNFVKAVRGKEEIVVTGESVLSSLKVIKGAYKSKEIKKPVTF